MHPSPSSAVLTTATVLVLIVGPDPHPPREAPPGTFAVDRTACTLARVGHQFVRCDDSTGAGARAPSWIPELDVAWAGSADPAGCGGAVERWRSRTVAPA